MPRVRVAQCPADDDMGQQRVWARKPLGSHAAYCLQRLQLLLRPTPHQPEVAGIHAQAHRAGGGI